MNLFTMVNHINSMASVPCSSLPYVLVSVPYAVPKGKSCGEWCNNRNNCGTCIWQSAQAKLTEWDKFIRIEPC